MKSKVMLEKMVGILENVMPKLGVSEQLQKKLSNTEKAGWENMCRSLDAENFSADIDFFRNGRLCNLTDNGLNFTRYECVALLYLIYKKLAAENARVMSGNNIQTIIDMLEGAQYIDFIRCMGKENMLTYSLNDSHKEEWKKSFYPKLKGIKAIDESVMPWISGDLISNEGAFNAKGLLYFLSRCYRLLYILGHNSKHVTPALLNVEPVICDDKRARIRKSVDMLEGYFDRIIKTGSRQRLNETDLIWWKNELFKKIVATGVMEDYRFFLTIQESSIGTGGFFNRSEYFNYMYQAYDYLISTSMNEYTKNGSIKELMRLATAGNKYVERMRKDAMDENCAYYTYFESKATPFTVRLREYYLMCDKDLFVDDEWLHNNFYEIHDKGESNVFAYLYALYQLYKSIYIQMFLP